MSGARVMGQIPDVVSRLIRWGHCSDNKKEVLVFKRLNWVKFTAESVL